MIDEAIKSRLIERAHELGIAADNDEAAIEAVLERDIVVPTPSEDECRRVHALGHERYCSSTLIEADHILFAMTGATPIDGLRVQAEATLHAVRTDPASFADRARELSNCPSGAVGGSLGQLTRTDCVPEFWQALAAFGKEGVLPTLVHSRFGLHVVRIARIVPGAALPFEQVHAQIAADLSAQSLVRAMKIYAEELAASHADAA